MDSVISAAILLYIGSYIANTFWPSATWSYLMLTVLAIVHILAFGKVRKVNRYLSIILIILGVILLTVSGAKQSDLIYALLNNAPIICLLLTVSLFTIPLHFEPYHELLAENLPRLAKSPFRFYCIALSFTTAIASLLNIASLPFAYNLLKEAALKYQPGILEKCLIRSTAINMFWSPAFISVALVIGYVDVTWFELLPSGIALTLMAFFVAVILGSLEFRGSSHKTMPTEPAFKRILGKLFAQLAILIVFIAGLQYLTGKSALVTVPLVSFTGPLLLALVYRRLSVYRHRLKEYMTISLASGYNEMILFTAFGFFGYALGLSSIKNYIPLAIKALGFTSPLSLIPLITLFTAFPCLFGIHPIITMSTIAITLPPDSIALTKIQMAGALLLGYVLYANLSPFSAVNLLILGITKGDIIRISLRQNWLYALIISILATLILTFY